jgi:hypothetical protein
MRLNTVKVICRQAPRCRQTDRQKVIQTDDSPARFQPPTLKIIILAEAIAASMANTKYITARECQCRRDTPPLSGAKKYHSTASTNPLPPLQNPKRYKVEL